METVTNILITIAVLIVVLFLLNFINKAAEYLEAKALEAGNKDLANLIEIANSAITQAVSFINQTYVDSLKASGKFTKEAQEEAFRKAYDKAVTLITEDAVGAIEDVYGNFSEYLTTKIEETVRSAKKE